MNTIILTDKELQVLIRLMKAGFVDLERWGEKLDPEMEPLFERLAAMAEEIG